MEGREQFHEYEHCLCRDSRPPVVKTSWTKGNPGRRFKTCVRNRIDGGCNYFKWVDPPMCERSKQVIPGLLRRIQELESDISLSSGANQLCGCSVGNRASQSIMDLQEEIYAESKPRLQEDVRNYSW